MTDPQHEETFADTERKLREIITTLRAQLAAQIGYKNDYKAAFIETSDDWQEAKARAERAEQRVETLEHEVRLREAALSIANATLAAPEVMHEDAPAAIIGEIGNQIHNLGCELQNDEDVSLRLSDLACRIWDAAKLFQTEPTALDRMLAEAREKALREAAQACDWGDIYGDNAVRTILALIEKEKTK